MPGFSYVASTSSTPQPAYFASYVGAGVLNVVPVSLVQAPVFPKFTVQGVHSPQNTDWQGIMARKKLQEIAALPDNWNGEGSHTLSKELIHFVDNLLQSLKYKPELFPTADEYIQMEYEKSDGAYLEFRVKGKAEKIDVFELSKDGEERYDSVDADSMSINSRVESFYEA